jgi:YtkA-like protein
MANSRFAAGAAIGSVMAMLLLTGPAHAAAKDYRFEVVQAQPAGKNLTDLAVKLTHITDGKPVTGAVIFQTKADMGPSGMGEMTGKVTPQPADPSGLYHFRIETGMAGTWALTLAAKVPGEQEPVRGQVVVTVSE